MSDTDNINWEQAPDGGGVVQGTKVACVACKRNAQDPALAQKSNTPAGQMQRGIDDTGIA